MCFPGGWLFLPHLQPIFSIFSEALLRRRSESPVALRATRLFGKDEMGCFLCCVIHISYTYTYYIYISVYFWLELCSKVVSSVFFSKGIHSVVLFRLECLIVFWFEALFTKQIVCGSCPFFWGIAPKKWVTLVGSHNLCIFFEGNPNLPFMKSNVSAGPNESHLPIKEWM